MVARVQADLGRFATLPDAALADDLRHLLGRPATAGELANARSLLARVLDLPSGLPIMTIHGFCQSLLRRFPLEAGVPAHFDVIEPRTAADLMREAQEEVLASRQAEVQADLATLAVLLGESTLAERARRAARAAPARRRRPRRCAGRGRSALPGARPAGGRHAGDGSRRGLRRPRDRPERAARRLPRAGVRQRQGRRALRADHGLADAPTRAVASRALRTTRPCSCAPATGQPKAQSNVITGQAATPAAVDALMAEQERLAAWAEKAKAARVAERTAALLRVGVGGARALCAAQGAPCGARLRRPDRARPRPPARRRMRCPGCSTSSTSRSIICWSTRARTRALRSGRSSRRSRPSSSSAAARARQAARCSWSATRSSRS